MRYLIIGNSAAAIGAVEGIRQIDKSGQITVITNEKYAAYSRPLISYLLLGKVTEEKMRYRGADFYEKNNCGLLTETEITKIDNITKTVTTSSGAVLSYDKLVLATGSTPFVPPMEGLDKVENRFGFYTLDDAKALRKAINKDSRVLIVGAGLIGLKCAEGIANSVASVTLVDLAPKILSSILDDEGAARIKEFLEGNGLKFKLSAGVTRFEANEAFLGNGESLAFDVLVLAIGVRANTKLAKDLGAEVNRGIAVNARQETSVKDVFAAGDCTESYDIASDATRVLALLPCAYMQGECAGINMAGGDKLYDKAVAMNSMGLFGLHIATAGSYVGESYVDVAGGYKRLFYKDDLLKGYIIIGNVEKAGIYTSLIRNKTKLCDIDFPLICKKPGLMAFSRADREKMLGEER